MTDASESDECIHIQERSWCAICQQEGKRPVYITSGGSAFHRVRDCQALLDGQEFVISGGGTPAEVVRVSRGSDDLKGRSPCLVCRPD